MKAKRHNGSLGLLPRVAPVSLLEAEFWGRNGVKMASPLPFLNFHVRHARPSELMIFSFFSKLCCSLLYFFSKNPIIAYKLRRIQDIIQGNEQL